MTTAGLQMASPDCFKKPSLFVSPGAFSKGASRQWLSVGVGEEGERWNGKATLMAFS